MPVTFHFCLFFALGLYPEVFLFLFFGGMEVWYFIQGLGGKTQMDKKKQKQKNTKKTQTLFRSSSRLTSLSSLSRTIFSSDRSGVRSSRVLFRRLTISFMRFSTWMRLTCEFFESLSMISARPCSQEVNSSGMAFLTMFGLRNVTCPVSIPGVFFKLLQGV